jgi:hypothetical protein
MIKNQNIGAAKIMQRGGHFGRPFEIILRGKGYSLKKYVLE